MHPGVWSVLLFATDEFHKIRLSLTKHVKRVMIPALVEVGAHRAECHSMEGHAEAHAWLELLGAEREGVRPRFGKNGEDFECFSSSLARAAGRCVGTQCVSQCSSRWSPYH